MLDEQQDQMRSMNMAISEQQFRIIKACNPASDDKLDSMLMKYT
jgi:hypothetical protein